LKACKARGVVRREADAEILHDHAVFCDAVAGT
jgi:hypothetical protein